MKKIAAYLIVIVILMMGVFYSGTLEFQGQNDPEIISKGVVLSVEEIEGLNEQEDIFSAKQWMVQVKITEGIFEERVIETIHYEDDNPAYNFSVYPGDRVVLSLDVDNYILKDAYISGIARDHFLFYLFLLFVIIILLIGSWQGVRTILSLVVTGWAVLKILLPAILAGKDPVITTIIVCIGVTIVTLMLITGFSRKSLAAICGTVAGIFLGGVLAKYVITITRINGLSTEESRMFFYTFTNGTLDATGLLFAGIVIGSLGAVMDVATSISSSVSEIYQLNPDLTFKELVKSGLAIGRDIIGTMANTLILAYTGSALPLMLLLMANDMSMIKVINLDMIATEIIRALAGSVGLFAAVPFTALISAGLYKNKAF